MITDRKREEELTGAQDGSPYSPEYSIQSDFVMVYGIGNDLPARIAEYNKHGYITHLMTGVSWGSYLDYLEGRFDGRKHWDESQQRRDGEPVLHGPQVPYMIPSNSFADYLIENIKPAIDAGVFTIHMEEPEIWVFSGYSDAIKREYRLYYHEDWVAPHTSPDAYFKVAKLKNYLYTRTLDRISSALKEYAMTKYGKELRFIVPTHSLINYTQFGIVSPESSLMDRVTIDGYIAQIWTGTSRVANVYHGERKERIFETSFLEYGIMQELIRGTNRKMWLLQDPIEDNPEYDWDDYRKLYLQGLTAALLQPKLHQYEICPWPRRVWKGLYPRLGKGRWKDLNNDTSLGKPLPKSYETTLMSTTQALRDMDQPFSWIGGDSGLGVLIADSCMYQRNYEKGVELKNPYPEKGQESNFSPFYGLTLPLLKRGIHVLPVQLDNVRRFPGYLDDYKTLILSYEYMKPEQPDLHLALVLWVRKGGTLVVVGDGTDDFHDVQLWWKQSGYRTPTEHLLETLGLAKDAAEGIYTIGSGRVEILRKHPSALAYHAEDADSYVAMIENLLVSGGTPVSEKNYFALRRGPYVICQVMEDGTQEDFVLDGTFVNLYDPDLSIMHGICLKPGENLLAADLAKYDLKFCLVGSAGRVENYVLTESGANFTVHAPIGCNCVLRFKSPKVACVEGADAEYDAESGTLLLRLIGDPDGKPVKITF